MYDVWGSVGAAAEFIAQNLGAYSVVWQAYGREGDGFVRRQSQ